MNGHASPQAPPSIESSQSEVVLHPEGGSLTDEPENIEETVEPAVAGEPPPPIPPKDDGDSEDTPNDVPKTDAGSSEAVTLNEAANKQNEESNGLQEEA